MATLTSQIASHPIIAPVFDADLNMIDMIATFHVNWVDEKGVPQMTSQMSVSVWDAMTDEQKANAKNIRETVLAAIKAKV